MKRTDRLRRLHFVNSLFSSLTGHDLYLAQQIDAAIAFSLNETGDRPPADEAFARAAAVLLDRLCDSQPRHGFFHWDAGADSASATPLFARARVIEGLLRLAAYPESTFLVTNLRSAHCPPRRHWTARRDREYDDTLSLINDLAVRRSRRGASLKVLFL
ncbi:MAG: hypothetical protein PHQ04_03500 [Opitutaceae bacterium]|nr:hypothetical protein [Opitutaceae bacterium]